MCFEVTTLHFGDIEDHLNKSHLQGIEMGRGIDQISLE